jgi:hypothetical protein
VPSGQSIRTERDAPVTVLGKINNGCLTQVGKALWLVGQALDTRHCES